jgi:hypothetical protein
LEKRAEQALPGSEGKWRREGWGREQGEQGGEVTQTMYAHMNKESPHIILFTLSFKCIAFATICFPFFSSITS